VSDEPSTAISFWSAMVASQAGPAADSLSSLQAGPIAPASARIVAAAKVTRFMMISPDG